MSLKTTRSLLTSEVSSLDYDRIRTADPRFQIWESATDIIKENPFLGVGYSEVKPRLIEKNMARGLKEFAKERLNSHNQFLQFSLESGIWACILYAVFLLPIYFVKENRYLSFSFSATFFFYSMFEDSLILINGVSLLFFLLLFYTYLIKREKNYLSNYHFLPKSAGISPHTEVSHLIISVLYLFVCNQVSARAIRSKSTAFVGFLSS